MTDVSLTRANIICQNFINGFILYLLLCSERTLFSALPVE